MVLARSGMSELHIHREELGPVTVLEISGNLDALSAAEMKEETERIVEGKRFNVILNVNRLKLVDSSGVGAIVSLFKRCRASKGDVKIAGLCDQPREIFRLLRLDRAFEIYDSQEEAVQAFGD